MRTRRKNEFGMELAMFTARTGLTLGDIARACNVSYDLLLAASNGRRPGIELVPVVRKFMADYKPNPR